MKLSHILTIIALVVLSVATVSAATLEELEDRVEALEISVGALTDIVNTLISQVDTIMSIFSNDVYGTCIETRFCEAPSITCSATSECGTDGFVTNDYCLGDEVYRDYRAYTCNSPGTQQSSCSSQDTPTLRESCASRCLDGACVECLGDNDCDSGETCESNVCQGDEPSGPVTCSFRTNAEDGIYRSGSWIAVDADDDGTMEGYQYVGGTGVLSHCGEDIIALTPEGYQVSSDEYGRVMICVPSRYNPEEFVWKKYWQTTDSAETSSDSVSPYSENMQETCEGPGYNPSSSSGDDEGSGSVTVTGSISAGTA